MNCKCFDTVKDKAVQKVVDGTRKKIVEGSVTAKWRGEMYRLSDKISAEVMLSVETEMRLIKKDGKPEQRLTKQQVNVAMSYCPFCGEKIER